MRTLLRFMVAGVLIASCSDGFADNGPIVGPETSCPPTDSVFDLPDYPLRLPLGAATPAPLSWYEQSCQSYQGYDASKADWASSDSSVVAPVVGPYQAILIEALSPGHATVWASADDRRDSMSVVVPDTVAMGRIVSIAADGYATCAVDEAGVTYCWGDGSVATTEDALCFHAPCTMPVERTTGAARARIGGRHSCVLDADGTARCWERGEAAQPHEVEGDLAFADLAIADQHTCGLATDANIYCWGAGDQGELGTGFRETGSFYEPKVVGGGHRFVSVTAWDHTSCGVTEEGRLLCWGYLAADGVTIPGATRCGTTFQDKTGPVTWYVTCSFNAIPMPMVPQGSDTIFVAASRACALTDLGSVYCSTGTRMEPIGPPGTSSFVKIASGTGHVCGLTAAGEAKCWGRGEQGQRGDGTTSFSSTPIAVTGGHAFTEIAAGSEHTCGLALAGDVWCWGGNGYGQAGVPSRSDTRIPQRVRGQP